MELSFLNIRGHFENLIGACLQSCVYIKSYVNLIISCHKKTSNRNNSKISNPSFLKNNKYYFLSERVKKNYRAINEKAVHQPFRTVLRYLESVTPKLTEPIQICKKFISWKDIIEIAHFSAHITYRHGIYPETECGRVLGQLLLMDYGLCSETLPIQNPI